VAAKRDPFWERIHPILGEAMRAAPEEAWPRPAHRGDGPVPQLSGRDQLALALGLCERAAPLVAGERAPFDEAVAGARAYADGKLGRDAYRQLSALADRLRDRRPREEPYEVARGAVAAARSLAKGGASANDVQKFTRLAAAALVKALGSDGDAVAALLDALDRAIVTRELAALMAERAVTPGAPVVEVHYRGRGDAAKVPGLFLVALEGAGCYGLFVKLKTRWQWLEGGRDEVMASVPDAHFDRAAAALRP